MKKAIVLLLALVAIGGFAFAAPDADLVPTISGDATLSWGVDIDAQITGFKNVANATLTMPFVKHGSAEKGGEGVYGYIKLSDFDLGAKVTFPGNTAAFTTDLDGNGDTAFGVSAKLVFNKIEVAVYGVPDQAIAKADPLADTTEADVAFGPTDTFGTSLTFTGDTSFGLSVTSPANWEAATPNTNNDYCIGAFASVLLGPAKANVALGYDLATDIFGAGIDLPVTLAMMKGLTITPAFDLTYAAAVAFDAGLAVELKLSDANGDGKYTAVNVKGYFSNVDSNVDLLVSFDEYLAGGLADNVEGGASFLAEDTFASWVAKAYAGYKAVLGEKDYLHARVDYKAIDTDVTNELKLLVEFVDTQIANTTLSATYTSGNYFAAPAVIGTFVVAAKVAF